MLRCLLHVTLYKLQLVVCIRGPLPGDRRMRRRKYELTHAIVLVLLVNALCLCLIVGELCMSHYMPYGKFLGSLDDYQAVDWGDDKSTFSTRALKGPFLDAGP
jgi:hypothetical protein